MSEQERSPNTQSRGAELLPKRWSDEWGTLSEEAVRRLHRPNYRHRFSALHKYPPGTHFVGVQRGGTCYVFQGDCEFAFGDDSVGLHARDFASMPAGEFAFRVVGSSEVHLLHVLELETDLVRRRRDAMEYLEDHGIYSRLDDGVSGKAFTALCFPEDHQLGTSFHGFRRVAPEPGGWALVEDAIGRETRSSFPNLKAACDQLISEWLDPNWKRLSREEAKLLLARSRRARLSEAEQRDTLESDLVDELRYALNSYLREELRALGHEVIVAGQVEPCGVCACCEHFSVARGKEALDEICSVCFWEVAGERANRMTLDEARKNFAEWGTCDPRFLDAVRNPSRKYGRVIPWRPVPSSYP